LLKASWTLSPDSCSNRCFKASGYIPRLLATMKGSNLKIALLSDVHANVPALQAAMAMVAELQADTTVILGDHIHYGPMPEETVLMLRNLDAECIQSSCDRAAGKGRTLTGEQYDNPHWRNAAGEFFRWTLDSLSSSSRKWLRELPEELRFQAGRKSLLCVHGLPGRPLEGLPEDVPSEVYDSIIRRSGVSILACGRTHSPSVIRRPGGLILNPGSVGGGTMPGGGTLMCLSFPAEGEPEVETVSFQYDTEALEKAYRSAGQGDIFLRCVKLGRDQRGNWHNQDLWWKQKWAQEESSTLDPSN
jgi:predicted phosphodiesterase